MVMSEEPEEEGREGLEEEGAEVKSEEEPESDSDVSELDLDAEIMADLEDLDNDGDESVDDPVNPSDLTEPTEEVSAPPPLPEETPTPTEEEGEEQAPDLMMEATLLAGEDDVFGEEQPQKEGDEETAPDVTPMDENGGETPLAEPEMGMMEEERLSDEVDEASKKKNIVEGALFVAGRPVSLEELNIKTEIRKRELDEILKDLAMDYLMRSTALEIVQIQDKFSLQIKPEYTPNVKKFASGGLIPDKHLKTLTIIALKQPLLKSTLVKIRGSGAYDHVKFLLDRGFIESRKKGRSVELTTTDQFADTFGLSRDMSTLKKQMITQLGIPEK